jgi:hypothetical protein
MAYVITAIVCLAIGFGLGYIVCWRNPPLSLIKKAEKKVS